MITRRCEYNMPRKTSAAVHRVGRTYRVLVHGGAGAVVNIEPARCWMHLELSLGNW